MAGSRRGRAQNAAGAHAGTGGRRATGLRAARPGHRGGRGRSRPGVAEARRYGDRGWRPRRAGGLARAGQAKGRRRRPTRWETSGTGRDGAGPAGGAENVPRYSLPGRPDPLLGFPCVHRSVSPATGCLTAAAVLGVFPRPHPAPLGTRGAWYSRAEKGCGPGERWASAQSAHRHYGLVAARRSAGQRSRRFSRGSLRGQSPSRPARQCP